MIPVEQKRDVFSSGVEGTASFEISGKDAAHIMTILRDTLYSDKVLAVLREYAANAWDANRMAGRGDVPIEVTLPTYADPTLKIKDNGPGLSLEDVFEVYNKYGASTKRDSNTAVGMLGIGSKSGFAYSDSFTIVSWHKGKQMTFVAVIDSSEKGKLDLLDSQDCDPTLSGVEISLAVKPHDISEFGTKAQSLFAYFVPQPKINITLPPVQAGWDCEGYGRILDSTGNSYYRGNGTWVAVMGCVPYRINLNQLTGLSQSARNVSGILWFDIGELQVAASREELKYGDATKAALVGKINGIIDKYVEHLLAGVDQLSQWERRLRVKQINDLYLPVPSLLKGFSDNYVSFDQVKEFKLRQKSSYRTRKSGVMKLDQASGISIKSDTRLVFRNEKRALTGYDFKENDYIVDVAFDDLAARKVLKEQITKHRLEGIPQVNISTLTWTKPATGPRSPVDAQRARAQCLVLSDNNINADRKSERWAVAVRAPLATDVYVILDSYLVDGFSDFYETYENDKKLLEDAGGKMPQIVGYRNTQARPIDKAKLKGIDYRKWRDDGYVKLLMALPGVAAGVNAKIWESVPSYGVYGDHIKEVGEDSPLGKFMLKVLAGKKDYQSVSRNLHGVVSRVYHSSQATTAVQEWEKLVKLYPLLTTFGRPDITAFGATHRKEWAAYVKMVDLHRKMDDLVKEVSDSNGKEIAA